MFLFFGMINLFLLKKKVNLGNVELILNQIAILEDSILRTRRMREERAKQNRIRNRQRKKKLKSRESIENDDKYYNSAYTTPTPEDLDPRGL